MALIPLESNQMSDSVSSSISGPIMWTVFWLKPWLIPDSSTLLLSLNPTERDCCPPVLPVALSFLVKARDSAAAGKYLCYVHSRALASQKEAWPISGHHGELGSHSRQSGARVRPARRPEQSCKEALTLSAVTVQGQPRSHGVMLASLQSGPAYMPQNI